MAAPTSVVEFLDLVRKSGVADEKKLDAYLAKARGTFPPEPAKVAGLLVHHAVLTNFQAENILAGKWRRFTIGKYKVLERLGSGGFAQVYLCEHKLMRRRVAVKVLPVAKAKDSSALERFYREARAAAALDHPNIVHAYDIDQDEDLHFLVMEYVDGANLQEIVKRTGKPLSVARACHYIFQAALGLQHAHEHSLVHRDIKPGNILVDRNGGVKVLDMGLALIFSEEDEQLTKKHDDGTLGTADYLSPEQAMDSHDVDIRTDIYSLGVTFYFLLTGKAPFEGMPVPQKLLSHQIKMPRPVSEIRNDAPPAVLAILMKMMAKNPNERYSTPGEVAQALEPFVQTPIAPPTDAELPRLSPAAMGTAGGAEGDSGKATASAGRSTPASGSGKGLTPRAATASTAVTATSPQLETKPTADESQSDGQAFEVDSSARSPATAPRTKRSAYSENRTKIVYVTLIAAFIVIPFILVVTIGVGIYVFFPTEEKKVVGPPMFDVSKDPANKKAKRSIQQAIKDSEIDSVITLLDDSYEENVIIEPGRGRTAITIKAAAGKEIVWKPAKSDPETPILRIYKGANLKLVGAGITLDGTIDAKRRVDDLLTISGDCSGLSISDLQFRKYERSAVFVTNGTGSANRPVLLNRLTILAADSPKARGAIYFDANPSVTPSINDFVQIDEPTFHGVDAKKAVQFKDKKVIGSSVSWPGR